MSQKRTRYSEEFKKNTLHLLTTSGKSRLELERDLGLSHGLLYKWQERYQVNPTTETLERSDVEQLKADVRRLQRENDILRQEREILKKTVSIFSQER
jgi:transposase